MDINEQLIREIEEQKQHILKGKLSSLWERLILLFQVEIVT